MDLFDFAVDLARTEWSTRPLCDEEPMEHPHDPADPSMSLIAWLTWHQPHGVVTSAPSAIPGLIYHYCVCGMRIVTPDRRSQPRKD